MFTVHHLQEYHDKQMERLAKQQARTAVKRERVFERQEAAYARFRQSLTETGAPARMSGSFWASLRSFLL